jgi:hypothetical protein
MRLVGTIAASKLALAAAWGSSSSSSGSKSLYYPNEQYDWLYDSATIAMKVEGCVWSTTDDNEDVGCMNDNSGDGTTYWYQMAMCRRAQVAYSVYATDSSSATCTSSTFKGSVSTIYDSAYPWLDFGAQTHPLPTLTAKLPTFSVCDAGRTGRICLSHGNIRPIFSHQ